MRRRVAATQPHSRAFSLKLEDVLLTLQLALFDISETQLELMNAVEQALVLLSCMVHRKRVTALDTLLTCFDGRFEHQNLRFVGGE